MPDDNFESVFRGWLIDHSGAVLKVARAYSLTTEDRQDLVQEILLQIWHSLPQFEGRASASTWCYRVALNTAIRWHGKEHRRRRRQQPLYEVEDSSNTRSQPQELVDREAVERLYVAIRQLPRAEAALILLSLDDLSYHQMAEVLGISQDNVGVKLNRAKKALGKLMKAGTDEF